MAAKANPIKPVGLDELLTQVDSLQDNICNENGSLQDAWRLLNERREKLGRVRDKIQSVVKASNERLKLNVGGTRFEIWTSYVLKNKYLSKLQSGTYQKSDPDGFFYIDKDPTYVPVVLNHLRDGAVDLSPFNDQQLLKIRADAEFFMVTELQADIDARRSSLKATTGLTICTFNLGRFTPCFNGIFFEVNVKKQCNLHAVSFLAGERRRLAAEAYLKEGGLDNPSSFHKIGEPVAQQVDKGQVVQIPVTNVVLAPGLHTLGIYSSSCPTAVIVCPRAEAQRESNGITLGRSYHTSDQKGNFTRRSGEDDFDFCGEIHVHF